MWTDALLDLVFPPRCEVCKQGSPEALCPSCYAQIKLMKPQLGLNCASAYEGVLKEALHSFKFKRKKKLAEPLGILLVNYLASLPQLNLKEIDYIVPVPLHNKRLRERGFNQVELLARVISRYHEIPVVSALQRIKNTHPQFDLPKEARLVNVRGAFKVADPKAVYNKKLLVVDDIYTTGSTISECVRVLKVAGAKQVEILALSRAI